MSSRLLTPPHAFPFPFYLKYVNSACNDTDTDTATAESSGVSNNASLSFERAGLLMGPHNSYVRAEAAFQLAMWQNERMPRVLSTAVAGGSTCTLTLFHLHVPLPFTPALLLPSLHLSLCCGLENRFINSIFRQIALRIEAASFRSSRLIFSFLISSHLIFPHLISSHCATISDPYPALTLLLSALSDLFLHPDTGLPLPNDFCNESSTHLRTSLLFAVSTIRTVCLSVSLFI